jgi:thiosulfate/3-mercaptopyruvate sulfurtransferase
VKAFGPLVSADWLRRNHGAPDLRIVDLRWYLDGRSGRDAYAAGHIPGAVFVDLDHDITAAEGAGRHPLPSREQFESAMRRAGINSGDRVVSYDDQGGFSAGRLWWLLRLFGHRTAAILDGGLQAWPGSLETGFPAPPPPGDFVAADPDRSLLVTFEELTAAPPGSVVIDARAPERYRGEVEPIDPRAGHIPGARNVPWNANLGPDRRFLPAAELRRLYAAAGIGQGADVIAYCGSGVSSVVDLIGLEVAGLPGARLYPGSWSDWSRRPGAPVATEDEARPRG